MLDFERRRQGCRAVDGTYSGFFVSSLLGLLLSRTHLLELAEAPVTSSSVVAEAPMTSGSVVAEAPVTSSSVSWPKRCHAAPIYFFDLVWHLTLR